MFGHTAAPGPVVALGEFDGFHLGHQQLVRAATQLARRERRPLVTLVMDDASITEHLMSPAARSRAALAHGSDAAHVLTVRSDEGAGAAIVDELVARMAPAVVMMACLPGPADDARFPRLRDELRARRVRVEEVDRWFDVDLQPVTSRRIREAVGSGDVAHAHAWLGAPYALTGEVVHGSGLGRTIGFPTANVDPPPQRVLPGRGVYSAVVTLPGGAQHLAAVNIGVRPTVERDGALLVEAHLLEFDDDLYGRSIEIGLRHWLRSEMPFESVDALVEQLALDARLAGKSLGR